ncbi:hypothetical protein [Spiroplasma ixodetis]|uniref:hypothetical protein n=1 Tax=Spiroplasma ixodetis TaxID=2141 RepID=UPI002577C4AD|nr:hypothetical protein [Spiroplasma ixodetis]WJG71380.1 hypothetical protein SIXOD_v1c28100 [Spiroplasma ixodetis Y32]
MQKVDGKDIAWLLRCKECSKTLKIKDVKETIKGDFKMCDKHLEMIGKNIIKLEMSIKNNSQKTLNI